MDISLGWGLCCESHRCRFRSHLSLVDGLRLRIGGMDGIVCLLAPLGEFFAVNNATMMVDKDKKVRDCDLLVL